MATYVGKVGGYDSYWSYCIHMDMFSEANDLVLSGHADKTVADSLRKTRAIFLTEIRANSFTLANNLLTPRNIEEFFFFLDKFIYPG